MCVRVVRAEYSYMSGHKDKVPSPRWLEATIYFLTGIIDRATSPFKKTGGEGVPTNAQNSEAFATHITNSQLYVC